MQTCQVCGKQNPAGVEYCEDCGAALMSTSPGTAAGSATPPPAAQPSGSPAPPPATATSGSTDSVAPPAMDSGTAPAPTPPAGMAEAASAPVPAPEASGALDAAGGIAPAPLPSETMGAVGAPAAMPAPVPPADATLPAPATGTGGNPRLLVKRFGALTSDEIPLLADRLVVGRFDPETGPVDIDLSAGPESEHISRQHGELYREADGSWSVRDLGSTNGVFVKAEGATSFGPRITAPRPLANGDEIAFGNARFVYRNQ